LFDTKGERFVKQLVAAALLCAGFAAPAAAEVARVKSSAGQAFVVRGASQMPARPGLPVEQSDTLLTKTDGRLALTFIDNTRFALGPNSNVSVSKFLYDRRTRRGEFEARVNRGSLAVVSGQIAKSRRDAMKVRTPTTLLGVRGTRFVVNVP
jgi:hypothetical protein